MENNDESQVQWCDDCGRSIGIGCNCGLTFAEKIHGVQVDTFSLLDKDRKRQHPQNKGLQRKTK